MFLSKFPNKTPHIQTYVLIVAILTSAMGFIDGSVVSVALPQIRANLGADFIDAQWISNAYLLLLGALILVGGALADQLGVKKMLGFGIGLFTLGSAACAWAPTTESLIGFRALQGAGAAIMIPGSMAIISHYTPRAERGRAMGIWVSASAITTSLGPFLGGILLTYGGETAWRWIFAINIPIGMISLGILKWRIASDDQKDKTNFRELDWIGVVLLTFAMALLAVGLTALGERGGEQGETWRASWQILLALGLIAGGISIWWGKRIKNPIVDIALFSSRQFSGANAITFLVWAGMGGLTFFLPMVLIVGWKLPPLYAGGMFLPFGLIIGFCSPLAGRLADQIGTRIMLTIGPVIVACAFATMGWAVAKHDYWFGITPSLVVLGCGIGLTASPVATAAVNAVPDGHTGAASGINNMVARVSNLFAIAGFGAFVSSIYALIVTGSQLPKSIQTLMVDAGFGERLTGGLYQTATIDLQVVAMDHAMIALCLVLALMSVAAALIGWTTQTQTEIKTEINKN